MEFKLEFSIPPFAKKIEPASRLFFTGSCFSENIAALFSRYKFSTISNTHGILYNPLSILQSLSDCLQQKTYTQENLFYHNEIWNSFFHHSRFSGLDAFECLEHINTSIAEGYSQLKTSDLIFITFGSAFAYRHLVNGAIVGNCHKIPQSDFQKVLLRRETIVEQYNELIRKLVEINPSAIIVFTVSPVRYIRDGVAENNLSKAILLQAVHELVTQNNNCNYFPAYEIVNDELRDYRFFEEDLVHPNKMAIQYVWERLKESAFSATGKEYVVELEKLLKAAEHRPFNPESGSYQQFRVSTLKKMEEFEKRFPHTNLKKEKKSLG
jgi:hypothetical protein